MSRGGGLEAAYCCVSCPTKSCWTSSCAVHQYTRPRVRCRLLCVEHLEENNKPCLYLVFEYLSTDLKKYMDRNGKGPAHPLDPMLVKVRAAMGGAGSR